MAEHREAGPPSLVTSPIRRYQLTGRTLTRVEKIRFALALTVAVVGFLVVLTSALAPYFGLGLALTVYLLLNATHPRTWRPALRQAGARFAYRWRNP